MSSAIRAHPLSTIRQSNSQSASRERRESEREGRGDSPFSVDDTNSLSVESHPLVDLFATVDVLLFHLALEASNRTCRRGRKRECVSAFESRERRKGRRERERERLTVDPSSVEGSDDRFLHRFLLVREDAAEVFVGDGVLGESLVREHS
jgi:hypothetical protein